MKAKRLRFLVIILLFIGVVFLLHVKVQTRQGVDYKVSAIKIPLYLKVLDFFDRHYNYASLVSRITQGSVNKDEKVLALFKWSYSHIRPQPQTLPVIDDHVWHIIVRGYGAGEQSSDVFTTLCNYAGADAFYLWIENGQDSKKLPFSFVKVDKQWIVFDVLHGAYFRNNKGGLASLREIKNNDWVLVVIDPTKQADSDYGQYFRNFPQTLGARLERSSIQSPLRRLIFQIERLIKVK